MIRRLEIDIRSAARCIAATVLCLLLAGCVTTELSSPPMPPEIRRLESLAPRSLAVSVRAKEGLNPLGSQFMLLVIPFGSIVLPNPEERVASVLERSLAIRGFKPEVVEDPRPGALAVSIEALEISAFDLLVTRRLSCLVRLSGTLLGRDGLPRRHFVSEVSDSELRRYGFQPELDGLLSKALGRAAEELLTELRL